VQKAVLADGLVLMHLAVIIAVTHKILVNVEDYVLIQVSSITVSTASIQHLGCLDVH
jgi:hypothetical protein